MFQKGDLVRAKGKTSLSNRMLQRKLYVVTRAQTQHTGAKKDFHWCELVCLDTGARYEIPMFNRSFEVVVKSRLKK